MDLTSSERGEPDLAAMASANSDHASHWQKSDAEDGAESQLQEGDAVHPLASTADGLATSPQRSAGPTCSTSSAAPALGEAGFESSSGQGVLVTRPSDESILLQQNFIRAEEVNKVPYVAEREPLSALRQEYETGNDVFLHKISQMESRGYSHLRRTRGDGNCFFRAFIFGYLESILLQNDVQERERLTALISTWKPKLVEQGYQELVFEDAQDMLTDQLDGIARANEPLPLETLESNFRDDTISNMVVMYLRLVTAAEIKRRQEFFLPFIMGMYDDPPATVEMFLQKHVECMGEESDHIHIVAIAEALQVPIRVVYLDRSGADFGGGAGQDAEINCHDFIPEGAPPDSVPRTHLLYRPGHFDVIYLMQ